MQNGAPTARAAPESFAARGACADDDVSCAHDACGVVAHTVCAPQVARVRGVLHAGTMRARGVVHVRIVGQVVLGLVCFRLKVCSSTIVIYHVWHHISLMCVCEDVNVQVQIIYLGSCQ